MVVEAFVPGCRHPPLEGEDEAEDFDEVEGGDEDVLVGGADELYCSLREECHVFVYGVVGYVGVGGIVEGDEDVEEDCNVLVRNCFQKSVILGTTYQPSLRK